jgi:uncharacterized iron-regulated protein
MVLMMKKIFKLNIVLMFLCIGNQSYAFDQEVIYSTYDNKQISYASLIDDLSRADIVLIGEKHDEESHHEAEYNLLNDTKLVRKSGSVLLETFTPSQQKRINAVQQWFASGKTISDKSLPSKLDWNKWDWNQYHSLIKLLLSEKAAVIAANPNSTDVKNSGSFVPESKLASQELVRQSLGEIMGVDKNHALVGKQQFKDYYMAKTLIDAPKPAWLIAGAIHTSKDLGVPLHLDDIHKSKMKVIILTTVGTEIEKTHADYIWYLPTK